MKTLFGKRWLWVILALIFFSLVIWYGGPFVSVADYAPLGTELARIIAIVALVVLWGLRSLLRELKAARAGQKLVQAVAKQEDPTNARASADSRQMQQRFEEATNVLQWIRMSLSSVDTRMPISVTPMIVCRGNTCGSNELMKNSLQATVVRQMELG